MGDKEGIGGPSIYLWYILGPIDNEGYVTVVISLKETYRKSPERDKTKDNDIYKDAANDEDILKLLLNIKPAKK